MPFSPQSYTGQGIVQQTERSRVGELLGAGFAGLGAGIGKGIEKFQENRAEAKELRSSLPSLAKFMPKEDRNEFLEKVEVSDLPGLRGLRRRVLEFGEMQLQQERIAEAKQNREKEEQEGRFYQDLVGMYAPQERPMDFTPQISAAEQRLTQSQQEDPSAGFRHKFTFPKTSEEPPPPDLSKFYSQPGVADEIGGFVQSLASGYNAPRFEGISGGLGAGLLPRSPQAPSPAPSKPIKRGADISQREEMQALREGGRLQPAQSPDRVYKPAPTEGDAMGPAEMPGPSEEVRQAAKDLELLKVAQEKGETRLENADEMRDRITREMPKLLQENPLMAKEAYGLMYNQSDKLTFENRLALAKFEREIGASTVAGYGVAPSAQVAKEFREILIPAQEAMTGIKRLLEINDMDSPWTSLDLRQEAGVLQGTLQGALRPEIVGPGAVTADEQKLLKSIIKDPTKFWSLKSSNATALKTLLKKVERGLAFNAKSIAWQGGGSESVTPVQGPQRVSRDKFGKIITE
jgi:hypothetical protein